MFTQKKQRVVILSLAVLGLAWLLVSSVRQWFIVEKARELQAEVKGISHQAKEENWYLDDISESELIELIRELIHIENETNFFNQDKAMFLLKRYELEITKARSRILYQTDAYRKLRQGPLAVSEKVYQEKLAEAQNQDRAWKMGLMAASWEEGYVYVSDVGPRGFRLLDNKLVPCSFEEMIPLLYTVQETVKHEKTNLTE